MNTIQIVIVCAMALVTSLTALVGLFVNRRGRQRDKRAAKQHALAQTSEDWLAEIQTLRRAMGIPSPLSPLEDTEVDCWCLSCQVNSPKAGFDWTWDGNWWFCETCRTAYDRPEAVLNPPVNVVDVEAPEDDFCHALNEYASQILAVSTTPQHQLGRVDEPDSLSVYCQLGICRDCGDLLDEHSDKDRWVPYVALCLTCRKHTVDWTTSLGGVRVLTFATLDKRLDMLSHAVPPSGSAGIHVNGNRSRIKRWN